jgi:hypothetical protein
MGVDEAMRTGVRVVRATLTAGTVLALAAGAHRLGGGILPPFAGLVALGSIVLLLTTFLSRWHLSLATLLPILGAAQYALHHALGMLSTPGGTLPARGMHDAMSGIALQGATGTTMDGMASGMPASMTAAHVAATVATALVLVGGDRAARMALHWWFSVLPLVRGHRPVPVNRLRPLVPSLGSLGVQVARPCAALRRSDPRRGPPPSFA